MLDQRTLTIFMLFGIALIVLGAFREHIGGSEVCVGSTILHEGSCCPDLNNDLQCDGNILHEVGQLNAIVEYDNKYFHVKNLDNITWTYVTIEVDNRWQHFRKYIDPNQSVKFTHEYLLNINREPLPADRKISNITIYAPQGVYFQRIE